MCDLRMAQIRKNHVRISIQLYRATLLRETCNSEQQSIIAITLHILDFNAL